MSTAQRVQKHGFWLSPGLDKPSLDPTFTFTAEGRFLWGAHELSLMPSIGVYLLRSPVRSVLMLDALLNDEI